MTRRDKSRRDKKIWQGLEKRNRRWTVSVLAMAALMLVLIAFMIPTQITFITTYLTMADWKLLKTLWPQILPFGANAFGIFMLRQSFKQIPDEIIESAKLDSAGEIQIMLRIILPQAARIAFPPLFSSLISLTKDTSLASNITVIEMFSVAQQIAARYYEPFALYCEAAVIYLIICTGLTCLQSYMEKKLTWNAPVEDKKGGGGKCLR